MADLLLRYRQLFSTTPAAPCVVLVEDGSDPPSLRTCERRDRSTGGTISENEELQLYRRMDTALHQSTGHALQNELAGLIRELIHLLACCRHKKCRAIQYQPTVFHFSLQLMVSDRPAGNHQPQPPIPSQQMAAFSGQENALGTEANNPQAVSVSGQNLADAHPQHTNGPWLEPVMGTDDPEKPQAQGFDQQEQQGVPWSSIEDELNKFYETYLKNSEETVDPPQQAPATSSRHQDHARLLEDSSTSSFQQYQHQHRPGISPFPQKYQHQQIPETASMPDLLLPNTSSSQQHQPPQMPKTGPSSQQYQAPQTEPQQIPGGASISPRYQQQRMSVFARLSPPPEMPLSSAVDVEQVGQLPASAAPVCSSAGMASNPAWKASASSSSLPKAASFSPCDFQCPSSSSFNLDNEFSAAPPPPQARRSIDRAAPASTYLTRPLLSSPPASEPAISTTSRAAGDWTTAALGQQVRPPHLSPPSATTISTSFARVQNENRPTPSHLPPNLRYLSSIFAGYHQRYPTATPTTRRGQEPTTPKHRRRARRHRHQVKTRDGERTSVGRRGGSTSGRSGWIRTGFAGRDASFRKRAMNECYQSTQDTI